MSTRTTNIVALIVLAATILAGVLAWPQLPDRVATHWNADGQPDGFGPRLMLLAIGPIVVALLYALFLLVPRIDPLKENIAAFRGYFNAFIASVILFMAYIQGLSLAWNLGHRFDMSRVMAPAMGVLLFITGVLLEHARPNWFIGIRTPWTLSSTEVWYRTHQLGARLFKVLGILALLGFLLPGRWALAIVLGGALGLAGWTFVYSYWAYSRLPNPES